MKHGATSFLALLFVLFMLAGAGSAQVKPAQRTERFQAFVIMNERLSGPILGELSNYGTITHVIPRIQAVGLLTDASGLDAIRGLRFVRLADRDLPRWGTTFEGGMNTWHLDQIDVTDFGLASPPRTVPQDGTGVTVAVLDSGLVKNWRDFFDPASIRTDLARAFSGGGAAAVGAAPSPPNQWERDTSGHGTMVTSVVLGFSLGATGVNGVAPGAGVVPVKVLNNNVFGWSVMIAAGISYIAGLKDAGILGPTVINLSLGGPSLSPVEQAAIEDALGEGVVIVAGAGNSGEEGMDFPAAFGPVISAAASGWTGEWGLLESPSTCSDTSWWRSQDVSDPSDPNEVYITDFSGRQTEEQDLDVAAPGSWIVGPFPGAGPNLSGNPQVPVSLPPPSSPGTFFFVAGTSFSSPNVAGTVALMLEKNPTLGGNSGPDIAAEAESILEATALPIPPAERTVCEPFASPASLSFGADSTGAGLLQADAALLATPAP